jgi:hypothetical protein
MVFVMLGFAATPVLAETPPSGSVVVDHVWEDLDMDGLWGFTEPDFTNVTVNLFTCAGAFVATRQTNTSGDAFFIGLPAGDYFVEFIAPAGFVFSPQDVGSNDMIDSDPDPLTGRTICFTLAAGAIEKTVHAGLYKYTPPPPAALGNFVWLDANNNGVQEFGENGVPNVPVSLFTCDGVFVSWMFTDANGFYHFTGLTPGSYYVQFTAPDGFTFSPLDQGDDAFDSDAGAFGVTACTTLEPGEDDLTVDAGLYKPPAESPGTGTPGYWKNHPEAWPVEHITIGGVTFSKASALYWLGQNDRHDKTITMFRSLVAAKLNILIGNEASCIQATVLAADAWMATYRVGSGVRASTAAWQQGEPLYLLMDAYNNGFLCAPSRG